MKLAKTFLKRSRLGVDKVKHWNLVRIDSGISGEKNYWRLVIGDGLDQPFLMDFRFLDMYLEFGLRTFGLELDNIYILYKSEAKFYSFTEGTCFPYLYSMLA